MLNTSSYKLKKIERHRYRTWLLINLAKYLIAISAPTTVATVVDLLATNILVLRLVGRAVV